MALLLPLLLLMSHPDHVSSDETACCVQQGLLLLDGQRQPSASDLDWTFCREYQSCSCCNISHVMNIQRRVTLGLTVLTPCQKALGEAACHVCHPEVGTGLLEKVCIGQCDAWYQACQSDFFGFDTITTELKLCESLNQIVCIKLTHLAADGHTFCKHLGIKTSESEDEDCWYQGMPVESTLCTRQEGTKSFLSFNDVKYIVLLLVLYVLFWSAPYLGL